MVLGRIGLNHAGIEEQLEIRSRISPKPPLLRRHLRGPPGFNLDLWHLRTFS
jgi:hypothetical protein